MAKTIKFIANVHLSENFGGIEKHGVKINNSKEVKKGTIAEIKNDELADKLVALKLAEPFAIEGQVKKA